jgi:hypothetical protein
LPKVRIGKSGWAGMPSMETGTVLLISLSQLAENFHIMRTRQWSSACKMRLIETNSGGADRDEPIRAYKPFTLQQPSCLPSCDQSHAVTSTGYESSRTSQSLSWLSVTVRDRIQSGHGCHRLRARRHGCYRKRFRARYCSAARTE